jgi:hypothetical protein
MVSRLTSILGPDMAGAQPAERTGDDAIRCVDQVDR